MRVGAPTRIGDAVPITDGDAVLFMNFRADRARQLTQALTEPEFSEFDCRQPEVSFVATTEYFEGLNAFRPSKYSVVATKDTSG